MTGFDLSKDNVIVGEEERLYSDVLVVDDVNWISIPKPEEEMEVKVKIRYRHDGEDAVLMPVDSRKVRIEFKRPVKSITPDRPLYSMMAT